MILVREIECKTSKNSVIASQFFCNLKLFKKIKSIFQNEKLKQMFRFTKSMSDHIAFKESIS